MKVDYVDSTSCMIVPNDLIFMEDGAPMHHSVHPNLWKQAHSINWKVAITYKFIRFESYRKQWKLLKRCTK